MLRFKFEFVLLFLAAVIAGAPGSRAVAQEEAAVNTAPSVDATEEPSSFKSFSLGFGVLQHLTYSGYAQSDDSAGLGAQLQYRALARFAVEGGIARHGQAHLNRLVNGRDLGMPLRLMDTLDLTLLWSILRSSPRMGIKRYELQALLGGSLGSGFWGESRRSYLPHFGLRAVLPSPWDSLTLAVDGRVYDSLPLLGVIPTSVRGGVRVGLLTQMHF